MNSKQAKKIRKAVRKASPDVVRMFQTLRTWPFRMRLQLAWELVRGVPRKRGSATEGTKGAESAKEKLL